MSLLLYWVTYVHYLFRLLPCDTYDTTDAFSDGLLRCYDKVTDVTAVSKMPVAW